MLLFGVSHSTASMLIHVLATARLMTGEMQIDRRKPEMLRQIHQGITVVILCCPTDKETQYWTILGSKVCNPPWYAGCFVDVLVIHLAMVLVLPVMVPSTNVCLNCIIFLLQILVFPVLSPSPHLV